MWIYEARSCSWKMDVPKFCKIQRRQNKTRAQCVNFCKFFKHDVFIEHLRVTAYAFTCKHFRIFSNLLVRKHWVKCAKILRFFLQFKLGFLESNFQLFTQIITFIYRIRAFIQIIYIKFPLNLFGKNLDLFG